VNRLRTAYVGTDVRERNRGARTGGWYGATDGRLSRHRCWPGWPPTRVLLDRAGRDYLILEAGSVPGSFFQTFPRHRRMISINKPHTGHDVRYAASIERVLAGHPDVDQAYVVGAPDEQTGEAIHAFVVPRDGQVLDPSTLSTMIRFELGAASVPNTITVITDVPLTPGGKPEKDALLNGQPVRTPRGP
jgi:hypothetical protein